MFALVCDHAAEEPRERVVEGVRFQAVYATGGETLRARLSQRAAARALARRGIREAALLAQDVDRAVFTKRGIAPIGTVPLYRATAAAIVRRYLAKKGLSPHDTTLAFAAERVTPELYRAIESLSADVRYLALRAPDGAALAGRLQRERGVAVRLCDKVPLHANLTVVFDNTVAEGNVLRLDDTLRVSYDSPYPNVLLAALWRAGALDADSLMVLSVTTAESQEKTCKMPPFPV